MKSDGETQSHRRNVTKGATATVGDIADFNTGSTGDVSNQYYYCVEEVQSII